MRRAVSCTFSLMDYVIDQRRRETFEIDLDLAPQRFGGPAHDLLEPFQDLLPDSVIKRADRALERCLLRDDVERCSTMQHRNADHSRVQRRDIARNDGLQGSDYLSGGHNGINGHIRDGTMPALAGNLDGEYLCSCHHRSACDAQPAQRVFIPQMERQSHIHPGASSTPSRIIISAPPISSPLFPSSEGWKQNLIVPAS